jgi:cytochrome P450
MSRGAAQGDVPRIPGETLLGGSARSMGRDGLAFYEMCERMGPIVKGRAYVYPFYVVTGPDLIEEILVKQAKAFHKPALLRGLRVLFGDGLLTADGDVWRHRRRMLQPVFHARRNETYGWEIGQGVERALSTWGTEPTIDVHDAVVELCIQNLTRTLFGVEDARLTADIKALASLCHEIVKSAMSFRFPYYGLLAMFPSIGRVPFGDRLRELEHSILTRVTHLHPGGARDDFFARLTRGNDIDGCPMRSGAVRDELITMLLAGHETAAAATSWALCLLAQHPKVLRGLVSELDSVCGDRLPTHADLDRLPLLDRVLVETYRLYPPTHRIGRTVVTPVTIGGAKLDVGAEVLIPQWAVHRSARHYEAPLEFRPERWTEAFMDGLPKYAYFPFSGGPRVCIGEALVTMEDALVLASIVKRYDISLPEGFHVEPTEGLTLLPGDGKVPLRLHRRVTVPVAEPVVVEVESAYSSDEAPVSSRLRRMHETEG